MSICILIYVLWFEDCLIIVSKRNGGGKAIERGSQKSLNSRARPFHVSGARGNFESRKSFWRGMMNRKLKENVSADAGIRKFEWQIPSFIIQTSALVLLFFDTTGKEQILSHCRYFYFILHESCSWGWRLFWKETHDVVLTFFLFFAALFVENIQKHSTQLLRLPSFCDKLEEFERFRNRRNFKGLHSASKNSKIHRTNWN